jgi:hypothetical protein
VLAVLIGTRHRLIKTIQTNPKCMKKHTEIISKNEALQSRMRSLKRKKIVKKKRTIKISIKRKMTMMMMIGLR